MKTRQCVVLLNCFFQAGYRVRSVQHPAPCFFAVSDTFLPDRIAWQKFATLIKGEGEEYEVNLNLMPPLTRAKSSQFLVLSGLRKKATEPSKISFILDWKKSSAGGVLQEKF
jgi:hypothetical protein